MAADVAHDEIEIDGLRFHCATAGDGPLVLFHHGFPSCWVSFRLQMEALADSFRVVSIDGLGANTSSKPDDLDRYRLPALVDLVDRIALRLGGDERFCLVGHDWGAALAWAFALARPERLHAVVAMSAPPYNQLLELLRTNDDQRTRSSYMWEMRTGRLHRFMTGDPDRLYHAICGPLEGLPHFDAAMAAEFRAAFAVPGAIDGGIDWYRANIPPLDRIDGFEVWPSSDASTAVPALQIWGDDDETFVPEFVDDLGAYSSNLTVHRMPGTRHWPMIEHPEEINALLHGFLGRAVTSSRSA